MLLRWYYYVMIMSAIELLEISRVSYPTKLTVLFANKKYGRTRTLATIKLLCGMYFWTSLKALLYHVDPIAYTLTMSSSNKEEPVKLLALGKCHDDIS